MYNAVAAQLLVLVKRGSTWVLMGMWTALALMFAYLLPYVSADGVVPDALLPKHLADNLLGGFPFFGGVIALMLGVLAVGSDYGWDTIKSQLIQRPGRVLLLSSKLVAVALVLVPFTLSLFVAGAAAAYAMAAAEGLPSAAPPLYEVATALAAGWFMLTVWAALGATLAVLTRGTALAIGLGVLYAFVVEVLLSALAAQVSWLDPLVKFLLRANGYSLAVAAGVPLRSFADNGPGSFSGPFVDGAHALLVIGSYLSAFLVVSLVVFARRDVA